MPSKHALLNYQTSVRNLQHFLKETPLAVWYDPSDHAFKVALTPSEAVPWIAGQYEVVHAFCRGYQRGYLRGRMDEDTE